MAKQVEYPADTVDSNGKVWETVGENIRNGAKKEIPVKKILLEALDMLYPVGSTYIGEIPEIFNEFGTWVSFNVARSGDWGVVYGPSGKIRISTDPIIPVMNKAELQKFKELIPDYDASAAIQIPIMKRIQ